MQTDDDLGRRVRVYALGLDDETRHVEIAEIAARRAHGTRNRRRAVQSAVAALTATALLVAAVAVVRSRTDRHTPITASRPVSVRVATDTRPQIRDAHLSRPVLIDWGILRLDPLPGRPRVSEARALASFRAGSPPTSTVASVTVVYAVATLRLAVPHDPTLVIQPHRAPVFEHRPAWVIISQASPHSCSLGPAVPSSSRPERQSVELIAADGSGEALAYQTAGSFCGRAVRPNVMVASYYLSLPWTVASRTGSRVVLRHAAPPACADTEYAPYSTSSTTVTLSVYAVVLMARPPCRTPTRESTIVRSATPNATLVHVKTGLSVGYCTPPPGQPDQTSCDPATPSLTYFDGTTHTIQ